MKTVVAVFAMILIAGGVSVAAAQDTGASLFKAKCAMCHGPDGSASTPMAKNLKIRDFHAADVQKQTDADLTAIVTKGKGKMPAYDGKLTKEQVAMLVSYVRELGKKH